MQKKDGVANVLLVATVGSSPEPIRKSIAHWRPARVILVASGSTEGIAQEILKGTSLRPHESQVVVLGSENELDGCVRGMRALGEEVSRWRSHGLDYHVAVDITGGTKQMTAALALHAHRWDCCFSYIGGTTRGKGGLGIVVDGSEVPFSTPNPWELLGFQAVEDFAYLFNRGAFHAANCLAADAKKRVGAESSGEFDALADLAAAYAEWERFDHAAAERILRVLATKKWNHLKSAVAGGAERLRASIGENLGFLARLLEPGPERWPLVADLLANAGRRILEGRFDDAVARTYRALEAMAQGALASRHGIADTGRVHVDKLPAAIRGEWSEKVGLSGDKILRPLGLQRSFELLICLGDEIGRQFEARGLLGRESELVTRNQSILAHGWIPVGQGSAKCLHAKAVGLAGQICPDGPEFPFIRIT